jgi:hypothetical protein
MSVLSSPSIRLREFDLKNAVSEDRLVELWGLMAGFHLAYLGATTRQGVAALFNM